MTNTFKEMKPCPFCGWVPIIRQSYGIGNLYITCGNPKCNMHPSTFFHENKSLKRQIDIWNQRKEERGARANYEDHF